MHAIAHQQRPCSSTTLTAAPRLPAASRSVLSGPQRRQGLPSKWRAIASPVGQPPRARDSRTRCVRRAHEALWRSAPAPSGGRGRRGGRDVVMENERERRCDPHAHAVAAGALNAEAASSDEECPSRPGQLQRAAACAYARSRQIRLGRHRASLNSSVGMRAASLCTRGLARLRYAMSTSSPRTLQYRSAAELGPVTCIALPVRTFRHFDTFGGCTARRLASGVPTGDDLAREAHGRGLRSMSPW
ncbi:hypothetical protein BD413DRAFT_77576 [Trametes elegans]|nr:hypothetical protein BD413DRAFT_77576 [Trametes elegans]